MSAARAVNARRRECGGRGVVVLCGSVRIAWLIPDELDTKFIGHIIYFLQYIVYWKANEEYDMRVNLV